MNTKIWEMVLNRLHIKYHEHQMPASTIFFCRLPNRLSFNMMVHLDGTVRLWRYICFDMPKEQVGLNFAYTKSENNGAVVGYEVTDECDLNCYAEQIVDLLEKNAEFRIIKQLNGFSTLITRMSFRYNQQVCS